MPAEVSDAAGLKPGDKVEWRFENGEIHGRKVSSELPVVQGKLVMRDGYLVLDTTGLTIDPEDIARAVREERDSRA